MIINIYELEASTEGDKFADAHHCEKIFNLKNDNNNGHASLTFVFKEIV